MKKALLAAVAMSLAFAATQLYAKDSGPAKDRTASKAASPDWRYRWHEGRWWYWMPESKWMVWMGSNWVPYRQSPLDNGNTSQTKSQLTAYADLGGQSGVSAQSGASARYYCPPVSSRGSAVDYAGYGWTWGPGTAFRDGPGRRY